MTKQHVPAVLRFKGRAITIRGTALRYLKTTGSHSATRPCEIVSELPAHSGIQQITSGAWTEVMDKSILESADGVEVWEARTPFGPNDAAVFMRVVQEQK